MSPQRDTSPRAMFLRDLRELVQAARDLDNAGAQEFPDEARKRAERRIRALKANLLGLAGFPMGRFW